MCLIIKTEPASVSEGLAVECIKRLSKCSEGVDMSPADVRGNDGCNWPNTMDAAAWARAFMLTQEVRPAIARDESAMLGWFANAIMAGYDRALDQCAGDTAGECI